MASGAGVSARAGIQSAVGTRAAHGSHIAAVDSGQVTLIRHNDDQFVVEQLLPACSFTSIACSASDDSSLCSFYWVDIVRGLLGRGLVVRSPPQEHIPAKPVTTQDSPQARRATSRAAAVTPRPTSPGTLPSPHRLRPSEDPRRGATGRADAPRTRVEVEVLRKGLARPSRVAVASGKKHSHMVFFIEEGHAAGGGRISVYNTITKTCRVLRSGQYAIRGLFITPKLDLLYVARPSSDDPCWTIFALDLSAMKLGGEAQSVAEAGSEVLQQADVLEAELPAVQPIVVLPLVPADRFGHAFRPEDVALMPCGSLLLATRSAAEASGPESSLKSCVWVYSARRPFTAPPQPPAPSPARARDRPRFNHQGYVREVRKREEGERRRMEEEEALSQRVRDQERRLEALLRADNPQENDMFAAALQTAVQFSLAPRSVVRLSSLAPMAAEVSPRGVSSLGQKAEASNGSPRRSRQDAVGPAAAPLTGLSAVLQRTGATAVPVLPLSSGRKDASPRTDRAKQTRLRVSPRKSARKSPRRSPPRIPRLDITRIEDAGFYRFIAWPPSVHDVLRASRHEWCRVEGIGGYDINHGRAQTDGVLLIRGLAVCPSTLRVFLACCGGASDGIPLSVAMMDLKSDAPAEHLLSGFAQCVAVDDHGTLLLRTSKGDGELVVMWGKGTVAWGWAMQAKARDIEIRKDPSEIEEAASDTPEGPRGEDGTDEKPVEDAVALWSKKLLEGMADDKAVDPAASTELGSRVNTVVVLRCRPLLPAETTAGAKAVITCKHDEASIDGKYLPLRRTRSFQFDRVYDEHARQSEVYQGVVAPVIQRVLHGYNCTICAYGQTSSGKTWTMEGSLDDGDNAGVIPRAVYALFSGLSRLADAQYVVTCSHIEIYAEELYDLLQSRSRTKDSSRANNAKKLRIQQASKRRVFVRGAREVTVRSADEIFRILKKAVRSRHTAETKCNRESSRSHAIFSLKIKCEYTDEVEGPLVIKSRLNLVDLSGSENILRSGAHGVQAREAGTINQGLLAFTRVLTGLVNGWRHIPYRDSKLTHLLSDSLGGGSFSTIILNVTPSSAVLDETVNTLHYGSLARHVITKPKRNAKVKGKDESAEAGLSDGGLAADYGSNEKLNAPVSPWEASVPIRPHSASRDVAVPQPLPPKTPVSTKRSARASPFFASSIRSSHKASHTPDTRRPRTRSPARCTIIRTYNSELHAWARTTLLDTDGRLTAAASCCARRIFDAVDSNHDGMLTLSEVVKLVQSWLPRNSADAAVAAYIAPTVEVLKRVANWRLTLEAFLAFVEDAARLDPLLARAMLTSGGYGMNLVKIGAELDALGPIAKLYAAPVVPVGQQDVLATNEEPVGLSCGFMTPVDLFDRMAPRSMKPKTGRPSSASSRRSLHPSQTRARQLPSHIRGRVADDVSVTNSDALSVQDSVTLASLAPSSGRSNISSRSSTPTSIATTVSDSEGDDRDRSALQRTPKTVPHRGVKRVGASQIREFKGARGALRGRPHLGEPHRPCRIVCATPKGPAPSNHGVGKTPSRKRGGRQTTPVDMFMAELVLRSPPPLCTFCGRRREEGTGHGVAFCQKPLSAR